MTKWSQQGVRFKRELTVILVLTATVSIERPMVSFDEHGITFRYCFVYVYKQWGLRMVCNLHLDTCIGCKNVQSQRLGGNLPVLKTVKVLTAGRFLPGPSGEDHIQVLMAGRDSSWPLRLVRS
jgi:hypothetical protein